MSLCSAFTQISPTTSPIGYVKRSVVVQADGTVQSQTSGVAPLLLKAFGAGTSITPIVGTSLATQGGDAVANYWSMDAFGASNQIIGRRSSGTAAAPTALGNSATMLIIGGRGHDGTSMGSANQAQIQLVTAEAWTPSAKGTKILFATTPVGSTVQATVGTISDAGIWSFPNGLSFGGATLNQYAEPNWTPVVTCTTPGDLSVVYANVIARSARIGKQVTVYLDFQFTPTFTTATGEFWISGLPYAPSLGTASGIAGCGSCGVFNGPDAAFATNPLVPVVVDATTNIAFTQSTKGAAVARLQITDLVSGHLYVASLSITYLLS